VESGQAPPLAGTEMPLKFEYATLVVTRSQRLSLPSEYQFFHAATLELLLENGCPPDIEDICRQTTLSHDTEIHLDITDADG